MATVRWGGPGRNSRSLHQAGALVLMHQSHVICVLCPCHSSLPMCRQPGVQLTRAAVGGRSSRAASCNLRSRALLYYGKTVNEWSDDPTDQEQEDPEEMAAQYKELTRLLAEEKEYRQLDEATWRTLARRFKLNPQWRAQAQIMYAAGVSKEGLAAVARRRGSGIRLRPETLRLKMDYLAEELALGPEDIDKIVSRFPQVLEYHTLRTLGDRTAFLRQTVHLDGAGITKVLRRAPSMLALSVEGRLIPRLNWLRQSLAPLTDAELAAMIVRQPSLLTSAEAGMGERLTFLQQTFGERARTIVQAQPGLLQFRVEGLAARIQFFREEVGLNDEELAAVVARSPSIFSMGVQTALRPKWRYLTRELGGDAASVVRYPVYFTLSLINRIIPRHHFLLLKGLWVSPLPLFLLTKTDSVFVKRIPDATLEEYCRFKEALENSGAGATMVHKLQDLA